MTNINQKALKEFWTMTSKLEAAVAQQMRDLKFQETRVRHAKQEWQEAKDLAASKKKLWEAARDELELMIRGEDIGQVKMFDPENDLEEIDPEFEVKEDPPKKELTGKQAKEMTDAVEEALDDPWEDWEVRALEEFGVSDGIIEAFEAKGLKTVGAVHELVQSSNKWYENVSGVGKGKADKVRAALDEIIRTETEDETEEEEGVDLDQI